ncbi:MAG: hypothetical protein ACXW12_18735 [Burkholderiales bacterium]|jgi:hypothetical protein
MHSTPSTRDRWLAPTGPIEDVMAARPLKDSVTRVVLLVLLLALLAVAVSGVLVR